MKKRAQMPGQIFIYILAMVIFSMTLIYGYKAIKHFQSRTEEVESLQLESDIKNEIEKMGHDYGSVKKKILTLPLGYEEACFISSYHFPDSISTGHNLIDDHINSGFKDKNMFLWPGGEPSFYIGDIKVENGSVCIDVSGSKIILKLESMGDYVEVSKWE